MKRSELKRQIKAFHKALKLALEAQSILKKFEAQYSEIDTAHYQLETSAINIQFILYALFKRDATMASLKKAKALHALMATGQTRPDVFHVALSVPNSTKLLAQNRLALGASNSALYAKDRLLTVTAEHVSPG